MEISADALDGEGSLFVVATPIGNMGDISSRAIQILRQADHIAAEDTRHSMRLLQHHGINTPMLTLHDFNESNRMPEIVQLIQQGKNIALISDAGTPLISDPGYRLVRHAHATGIRVVPVPGPSSVTAALSAAGLPTDRFCFEGFLPSKATQRRKVLSELRDERRTLVFLEAPHRILACFEDLSSIFEESREAVLCKELSKRFEKVISSSLGGITRWLLEDNDHQRGEFVVLVRGAEKNEEVLDDHTRHLLSVLVSDLPVSQAAALAARITGLKKNLLYQQALQIHDSQDKK